MAHVRRLLDIVACTAAFGPRKSAPEQKPASPSSPDAPPPASPDAAKTPGSPGGGVGAGGGGGEEPMYPPPKLGQFYEFFSFSHLSPPLHCEC